MTPKAFYEFIVSIGGEGVILKSKKGRYHHKRCREYQKVKKFLTREVIITGFTEPTDQYNGKFPKDRWEYWLDTEGNKLDTREAREVSAKKLLSEGYNPVTRFHYFNMIGNIRYGVIITADEKEKLPKNKKFNIQSMTIGGIQVEVLEVGDCAGFDDDMRNTFSFSWIHKESGELVTVPPNEEENNPHITKSDEWEKYSFIGDVVELKANEIFKDTGKLRHPRFLRMRYDKDASQCVWKDHIL